jgi:hypothetical protein
MTISTAAFGQNATLGGTVTDATGAFIPGVTMTATNVQTGIVTNTITNEAGAYHFASLQPGVYRASAELPGFQTNTYNNVVLGGAQQVRLNFRLEVSAVAQAVEVTAEADTLIATTSSSVGTVLPEYKVRDLPLADRDVFGLLATTSGTQSSGGRQGVFAGNRVTAVNVSRDGMNVTDGRYDNGAYAITYTSPDLVDEVRVIVSPADAETARGSGQVQMTTRSGTNEYRGSVFWANRNSVLDSNSWFNNFNGAPVDYYNRNQFGARLGGPIVRNKTFFFFLYDGQRIVERQNVLGPVLTAEARQGIFRFFPGVQNGNAISSNPTVDLQGNPVMPGGATGPLQSFNVFTRDPLRRGFDPSGHMQTVLSKMPLPNDFTTGDGLNTAGIRWTLRISGQDNANNWSQEVNRDQYNFRIDHNFSTTHKVSVTGTRERSTGDFSPPTWPTGENGRSLKTPAVYQGVFTSTLSPNVVNEFRAGWRKSGISRWTSAGVNSLDGFPTEEGEEWFKFFPQSNGIPFMPKPALFPEHFLVSSQSTIATNRNPLTQFSDTISWIRGQHAFKGGVDVRFARSEGGSNAEMWPRVFLGPGGVPVTGIDSTGIPGLVGTNQTVARSLLTDLSGSVDNLVQSFLFEDPFNPIFKTYPDVGIRTNDWRQKEFGVFFKDDWKIRPNLTLNLGVRYDYYGVPYSARGLMARPVGGNAGIFGISGTSFADMWQPGRLNGSLTRLELIGKNSPNPDTTLYNNDWNNIAPAVGLSWSLPWWGRDQTVLRAGYGISYTGNARLFSGLDRPQTRVPGMVSRPTPQFSQLTTLADIVLPLPGVEVPLAPVPLTDRNQFLDVFDEHRATAYIQNFNLELQRELARNLTLEIRYVGSKGTKLDGAIPINTANIFENGILEAFNITRAGGNAPLFDAMLRGLNLGSGVINGTTVTGSASLRQNTLFRAHIANGNIGQFADVLNRNPVATGEAGGLLRRNGFPENFITVNPQFSTLLMHTTPGNSTYHSLNVQVTKRLSQGFTNQTTYTWSRNIGLSDTDVEVNFLDPRDRSRNKALLGFHRTHDFRSNGTFELPFGPGRALLADAPSVVQRLVERWQFGAIFSMTSGPPLTITAVGSTLHEFTGNTPLIVGDFPKTVGKAMRVDNGVIYFEGLRQIVDPQRASVTTLQATQGAFSKRAITDAQGNLLLANPQAGQLGTLGQRWIEGPGNIGLDANLIKRVRIDETREFEVRFDAINVLNRPNFGSPELNINNTNFGRITSATGNRSFVVNARLNF